MQALHAEVVERFAGMLAGKEGQIKTPLQLQKFKPIPIAMYEPKFDDGYVTRIFTNTSYSRYSIHSYSLDSKKRRRDQDENDRKKLKAQYKQEYKGALRELRKDAAFLASQRYEEKKAKDQAYDRKIKSIYGILSAEQGEANKLEREKRKHG